jgi:hypothetical protein
MSNHQPAAPAHDRGHERAQAQPAHAEKPHQQLHRFLFRVTLRRLDLARKLPRRLRQQMKVKIFFRASPESFAAKCVFR